MKIFIDDGLSLIKKKTGIGHFSQYIIDVYKNLGHDVFTWNFSKYYCKLPIPIQRLIYLLIFNKLAFTKKYDLIIYINFVMPPFKHKTKVIVTIFDLAIFKFPETFSFIYRLYFKWGLRNSIKYSNYFFTDSNSVKEEIIDYFRINESKVFVVYYLIRNEIFSKINIKNEKQFLFVGVMEKRKNISLLCKTFKKFIDFYPEYKLVLIGKPGYGFKEISYFINDCPNISYLNYVSKDKLIEEYTKSCAFIFPSLYEGFGIPVIEAMKYELPIIASDIPTNKELNNRHNGNFIFFDPNNEESLLNAMIYFKNNPMQKTKVDLSFYNLESLAHIHKTILNENIFPVNKYKDIL